MEYFLSMKMNEILIDTTPWMILENTVLNKRSQAQRPHNPRFQLHEVSITGKEKTESRLLAA